MLRGDPTVLLGHGRVLVVMNLRRGPTDLHAEAAGGTSPALVDGRRCGGGSVGLRGPRVLRCSVLVRGRAHRVRPGIQRCSACRRERDGRGEQRQHPAPGHGRHGPRVRPVRLPRRRIFCRARLAKARQLHDRCTGSCKTLTQLAPGAKRSPMPAGTMSRSPLFWLCLLVGVALVPVGVLLWLAGDPRHALGAMPLVLLPVCPLIVTALQARSGSASGRRALAARS